MNVASYKFLFHHLVTLGDICQRYLYTVIEPLNKVGRKRKKEKERKKERTKEERKNEGRKGGKKEGRKERKKERKKERERLIHFYLFYKFTKKNFFT